VVYGTGHQFIMLVSMVAVMASTVMLVGDREAAEINKV